MGERAQYEIFVRAENFIFNYRVKIIKMVPKKVKTTRSYISSNYFIFGSFMVLISQTKIAFDLSLTLVFNLRNRGLTRKEIILYTFLSQIYVAVSSEWNYDRQKNHYIFYKENHKLVSRGDLLKRLSICI